MHKHWTVPFCCYAEHLMVTSSSENELHAMGLIFIWCTILSRWWNLQIRTLHLITCSPVVVKWCEYSDVKAARGIWVLVATFSIISFYLITALSFVILFWCASSQSFWKCWSLLMHGRLPLYQFVPLSTWCWIIISDRSAICLNINQCIVRNSKVLLMPKLWIPAVPKSIL